MAAAGLRALNRVLRWHNGCKIAKLDKNSDAKNINGHCNLARLWYFARKRPLYRGRKEEIVCGVGDCLKSHRPDR